MMRNRGRDGRLVATATMQRRRGRCSCIRREKSPGIALHRGGHATPALLDYDSIVVGQLRVPTRHGKCPPYMKIIFPSAEPRARYDRYLFKRLSRYILYVLWKSVRIRVIVLHRKSRRRIRLAVICATSRCRMTNLDDCESHWFFGFLQKLRNLYSFSSHRINEILHL